MPPEASGRCLRLLVVDDEPEMLSSLKRWCRGAYELVLVDSAASALVELRNDDAFDGILCDVVMPDMTGPQLRDEVRRTWPELARRFVFMSASCPGTEPGDMQLEKPFTREELARAFASPPAPPAAWRTLQTCYGALPK
jgi:CheY-like chemotaxis protein